MNYKDKKVAVVGFGIEGKDAFNFLKKQGARVDVLDQKQGNKYLDNLSKYDIVVRSPGVYRYKEDFIKAEKK